MRSAARTTRRLSGRVGAALILVIGLVVAASAPAGAVPAITLSPSTDVIDGSTISIEGTGFDPGQPIGAVQCRAAVQPTPSSVLQHCYLDNVANGEADADGRFSLPFTAHRWFNGDDPVDCAEPGRCVIGVSASDEPFELHTAPITFDETVANDPPLELDVTIDSWTSRSITATVTCSRPAQVEVFGSITHTRRNGRASASGGVPEALACTDSITAIIPAIPFQSTDRGNNRIYPFRRLLRGPATVAAGAIGRAGRWTETAETDQQESLARPELHERRRWSNDTIAVRMLGARVTKSGQALVRIELTCPHRTSALVAVDVLANAPGGVYRRSGLEQERPVCEGTEVIDLDITATRVADPERRTDLVPAGPMEFYVRATSGRQPGGSAIHMRPAVIKRTIVPETVRVVHQLRSRLRIGRATTDGVRASFRCGRTATFTIFSTAAQVTGTAVHNTGGQTEIGCVAGQTVPFTVEWYRGLRADQPAAVSLYAINGRHPDWTGPWQQTQGGWRTTS
ncbi:MAG: neocarzinostatin apoprotein domain-containing protein [Acidimicrobiales bacterium]